MTYVPRSYEEIVRDLLTTLTGGTVRESLTVPVGDGPIVLEKLRNRPVRRVSHLQGVTKTGAGDKSREIPFKFTDADFELISTTGSPADKDAISFRETGRRPVPGSTLLVNYYPVQTDPVPLTDLNVGSVVRTLVETFAVEAALTYLHLQHVYDSGFVETAKASALDRVVALVGVARLPPGHPVAKVRFTRRAGTPGRITIPTDTPLTDAAGNRYLTLSPLTLEPNETTRDVLAAGETAGTAAVGAGELNRLEVLIAGISEVSNPQPAYTLVAPETDEELRRRARNALHGSVRGTLDSMRFNLLSLPEVKSVSITEAPNGIYGEIKIEVAYAKDTPEARAAVARVIEETRPAGVRVISGEAARRRVGVRVELTLAGAGPAPAELAALTANVEARLFKYLSELQPGVKVRQAKLASLILEDERVTDAAVFLLPESQPETKDLEVATGETLDIQRPFTFKTSAEQQADAAAFTSTVGAHLPVHLLAGVTEQDATDAIRLAFKSHLALVKPDAPLTLDGVAAAVRDDTRYSLVRADASLTVESNGTFTQLTDKVGSYSPAPNETLSEDTVNVEVREGGV